MLRAEIKLPTVNADRYVRHVRERLESFEVVAVETEEGVRAEMPRSRGGALLRASTSELIVSVESATEPGLSSLKHIFGLLVEKAAGDEQPDVVWTGWGCGLERLPGLREMHVSRIADVTPSVRRITLTGNDLARFDGEAIHVRLLFPLEGDTNPEWPVPGANGRPVWPPKERSPIQRVYTIRRIDVASGEIDVDFVLHEGESVAAAWAARCQPGDLVGMLGPGGDLPPPAAWYLLAGDETAIPAIARIVERMTPETRGIIHVEISDPADIQEIAVPPGVSLNWLARKGEAPGVSTVLADAVLATPVATDEDYYCWLGAEGAIAQTVRKHWRETLGLAKQRCNSASYWRYGHREADTI